MECIETEPHKNTIHGTNRQLCGECNFTISIQLGMFCIFLRFQTESPLAMLVRWQIFHSADVSRVRCGQWVLWFLQWIARRSKKTESWSCSLFMAKSSLTQTFVGRFNLTLCRIANEKQRERDDEVNPLQLRLVCYIYFTIVVWHMHRHVLMSEIRIIAAVGNYCQTARMCYITAWNRKLYSNFMFAHTTVHAYSHYTRLCKRITKTQHLPC